ncbi:MAG: PDDEXK nuclease domain-containing protein [Endomicrobium sp.]|jgi:predicted nuclease of restriction endonuclease-like (RecB) superfamily|nr:PDDEXK nuclease domain-containing protein [Endomicrobium sp.]
MTQKKIAKTDSKLNGNYIADIKKIVEQARVKSYSAVNFAMVEAYWLIGERIAQEEQHGKKRADYGEYVIQNASQSLTKEFGKGFSERSIRQYRQFYLMFPQLQLDHAKDSANSVRQIHKSSIYSLTWSHIQRILRVSDPAAREWYMKESAQQMWTFRTLDRNITTLYYQRIMASANKNPVVREMHNKTKEFQSDKFNFIRSPNVLEFLGLPSNAGYTEADLEKAIITHIQQFMLELGKGFAFISRQQLIRTETSEFYIDLVFYNYILKCFVLVDLKTTKITHQDIGQLDMYVRMFDDLQKGENDNPTIGILLCAETDKTIAKYSVLNESKQLFASKYLPYLPTERELVAEIDKQKAFLKLQADNVKS